MSYQSIREQLISLQVDADDKEKLCGILEQKIDIERAKLGRIESDATEQYECVLESELEDGQKEIEKLRNLSALFMSKKKDLVKVCQHLVDSIKENEKDLSAECRKLHREATESLDADRKSYRLGHGQRLAKYLASKSMEEKDATARALQPEFARLRQMHEHEMAEVEAKAKNDERRLREEYQTSLTELVNEERDAHVDNQKTISRSRVDAVQSEFEASDREHRIRLRALQNELDKDLDKARMILSAKIEKERQAGQNEVLAAQETFQSRIQDLRKRHLSEMNAVIKDHDGNVSSLKLQAQKSRAIIEERLKEEHSRCGGDEGKSSSSDDPDADKDFMQEIAKERDRRLQIEIRHLQSESVRLERNWKVKAEEERERILSAREKEEQESNRRQRQLTEEVADIVVTREQLSKDIVSLSEQKSDVQSDLIEARKEINVYQGGISAHRSRIRDITSLHTAKMRDEEMAHSSHLQDIKSRTERARTSTRVKEQQLNRDLGALEAMHVSEMEKLDRQVKADVGRKDEDLDILRDAVQTEKVKVAKLEKLVKSQPVIAK